MSKAGYAERPLHHRPTEPMPFLAPWTCRSQMLNAFDRRSPWTNRAYEEIELEIPAGMHAGCVLGGGGGGEAS